MAIGARKLACGLVLSVAAACALPSNDEFARRLPEDLASDGGGRDGGKTTDASQDGSTGTGTTEAGAFVCPSDALFCDDFEATPVGKKWNKQVETGGELTSGEGSAGRGLLAKVDAHSDAKRLAAYLEQTAPLEDRKPFTISFDLNLSQVDDVGIVDIEFFNFHGPYYSLGLRMADYGEHFFVHDYGDAIQGEGVGDNFPIAPLVANRWTHVACSITFPEKAVRARITYDGKEIFTGNIPMDKYVGNPVYLTPGIAQTEHEGPPMTARIDNFLLTSP